MNQFKKGDKVKRVAGLHEGMRIGDIATVREQNEDYLYLEGYVFAHDPVNFELVQDEKNLLSTVIKSVTLPEVQKKTEAQIKLEELQKIIEDAQQKIAELKEEIK